MIELLPIETYDIILLSAGIVILLAALLPDVFEDRLITLPIFYLIFSGIVFGLLVDIDITHFAEGPYWAKRVTELAVIISLTGVGLKINKPFDKKTWSISSRLLIITMPITILLMALIGWWFLGFIPATAVLLGAVISPTDPVLAEEVQTTPPLEEDVLSTQVALTTEAGLNDGLAFPFTNMAIAIAFAGVAPAGWFIEWFLVDFLYKILIGSAVGVLLGYDRKIGVFSPCPWYKEIQHIDRDYRISSHTHTVRCRGDIEQLRVHSGLRRSLHFQIPGIGA